MTNWFSDTESISNLLKDKMIVSDKTPTDITNNGKIEESNTEMKNSVHEQSVKRTDGVLDWHEYFMASAFLVARRSKDPVTRVGAVIVNQENKIVGTGYNGMPMGCSDDEFPWSKNTENELDSKYFYVCHAEMNAIINKNSADTKNCKIYTSHFPCNECTKIIIQAGIKEVIYMTFKNPLKPSAIASKRMLDAAKINYWQYKPRNGKIIIDIFEDAC